MPIIQIAKDGPIMHLPVGRALVGFQPGQTAEVSEALLAKLLPYGGFTVLATAEQGRPKAAAVAPAAPVEASKLDAWAETLGGMRKASLVELAQKRGIDTDGMSVAALREALAGTPEEV